MLSGPYVIDNAVPNGVYKLNNMADKKLKQNRNGFNLKNVLEYQEKCRQ